MSVGTPIIRDMPPMGPSRAYLVLWIRRTQHGPVVVDAGIYGEERPSQVGFEVVSVPVLEAMAPSYQRARDILVAHVEQDFMQWDFVRSMRTYKLQFATELRPGTTLEAKGWRP